MGLWASLLTALGILRRKVSILVLGLDNSGKTTLIVHLMRSAAISSASSTPPQRSIPTVGFSLETFIYDNLSVTVFDMSGQGRYRDLWKHYIPDADGIIWVIDAIDIERIAVVKEEFWQAIKGPSCPLLAQGQQRKSVPIVFFANKMDLENSMTAEQIVAALGLEDIKDRNWNIIPCSALKGQGMDKGWEWLCAQLTGS